MKDQIIHISINSFGSLDVKNGDKIECTYSMCKERIGKVFTVTDKDIEYLSFLSRYGDKFKKL